MSAQGEEDIDNVVKNRFCVHNSDFNQVEIYIIMASTLNLQHLVLMVVPVFLQSFLLMKNFLNCYE
jgi:hypothetical protein